MNDFDYNTIDKAYNVIKDHVIKTPLVTNLSTSMAIDDLAKKYGVNVVRTKVGEINVVNEMKKKVPIWKRVL